MLVVLHKNTVAYRVILILKAYKTAGFNITLNMFLTNPEYQISTLYNFPINNIKFPLFFRYMRRLRWISLLFLLPHKLKTQLIKSEYLYIDAFFLLPFAYFAKIFYGLKIIYDQREMFIFSYKGIIVRLFDFFERFFVFATDTIYTVDSHNSFWEKRYKVKHKNVTVIMNVPSLKQRKVKVSLDELIKRRSNDKVELVYIGDIKKGSGVELLVSVLKMLPANFNLNLLGYRDEDYTNLIKQNAELDGLSDRIIFYDWMPYEKLVETISKFNVGMMTKGPSYKQNGLIGRGNSRKVFTYMHAGLPVIGPDYNSMALQIEEENCGLRVDIENPIEIYEGILKITRDSFTYKTMVRNAINAIIKKYNWELEVKKIFINIGYSIFAAD